MRLSSSQNTNFTTQQLYLMAPDSPSAIRRKLRLERMISEKSNDGNVMNALTSDWSVVASERSRSYQKLSAKKK